MVPRCMDMLRRVFCDHGISLPLSLYFSPRYRMLHLDTAAFARCARLLAEGHYRFCVFALS